MLPNYTSKRACPLCADSSSEEIWPTRTEQGTVIHYRLCACCETAYPDPQPGPTMLKEAYSAAYYGTGGAKFGSAIERFRTACARAQTKRLVTLLPDQPKILDVGCGDARFLQLMREEVPGEYHGIEPPGGAADRAAQIPDIILHRCQLADANLAPESFDLVTMRHVFEHLPDPVEAIAKLAHLTKINGHLCLSLPNIHSWQARLFKGYWFHLDPPRHLILPPPSTLVKSMKSYGLVLIRERYWSLEQNLYGWLQSSINGLDFHRNFLYERLKGNKTYLPQRGKAILLLHAALASLILPIALILDLFALPFKKGATVELLFMKNPWSPHV